MNRATLTALAMTSLLCAHVGCGGSGDESASSTETSGDGDGDPGDGDGDPGDGDGDPGDGDGDPGDGDGDPGDGDGDPGDGDGDPGDGDGDPGDPVISLAWATYLGGNQGERIGGDSAADDAGFFYAASDTRSPDFPVTAGVIDETFNDNNNSTDAYVAKIAADGSLVWATYVGGATRDSFNAIRVDGAGYIYVAGAAGPDAPTTQGSLQPVHAGGDGSLAGGSNDWDGYVAKITPDGTSFEWATFVGTGTDETIRGMDIDDQGNVYVATGHHAGDPWPAQWFAGAFQSAPQGANDSVVIKIAADGASVVWASYIGSSGNDSDHPNVAVGPNDEVAVLTDTPSASMPTTNGAFGETSFGGRDAYVALLSADGSTLTMGTYIGGSDNDGSSGKRAVGIDGNGDVFVAGWTQSNDFPATQNSFAPNDVGAGTWMAKISPAGELLAAAWIGTSEGLSIDDDGYIYIGTGNDSGALPTTPDAVQPMASGAFDGWIMKADNDLSQLIYASYYGGSDNDGGRSSAVSPSGDAFYLAGSTSSQDFPVVNALQPNYAGGPSDAFAVRFDVGF